MATIFWQAQSRFMDWEVIFTGWCFLLAISKNKVSSRGGLQPPVRSEPNAGRLRGRPYA